MEPLNIGFALCGSFCTFSQVIPQLEALAKEGHNVFPIMSENAGTLDTRFGTSTHNIARPAEVCGREVITDISAAEPIGPKDMTDIMVVAPCTSNTAAKLAAGMTDGAATMAVKSHLRSGKPVVLAIASNDSLLGSAKNIGELFNRKNYYFVPMLQDDIERKPVRYNAEEWITDKYAVNKKHTKLYPLSAKFRRKTIDRKDFIFNKFNTLLNDK